MYLYCVHSGMTITTTKNCKFVLKRAETGVIPGFQGFSHSHARYLPFSLYGPGTTKLLLVSLTNKAMRIRRHR
jgi:hypothetical protein